MEGIKPRRYDNLDGLRTVAAIGVLLMHVLFNGAYVAESASDNFFVRVFVQSLLGRGGEFIHLFLIISGFALCCGYYERFKNNQLSLDTFYKRRYFKVFPFFALLVLCDIFATAIFGGFSVATIYEAFANLTLAFGLFPAPNMTVVGVAWTLGAIFGFYILFPFFVFLLWTKRRAWITFFISLGVYFVCTVYFVNDGIPVAANTVRWFCCFVAGGLIYLYREPLEGFLENKVWLGMIFIVVGILFALMMPKLNTGTAADAIVNVLRFLFGFSLALIGSLTKTTKILSNRVTKFVSGISLEIYLSHMLIFRVLEKIGLLHLFPWAWFSYLFAIVLVLAGAIGLALAYQSVERLIVRKIRERKQKKSKQESEE